MMPTPEIIEIAKEMRSQDNRSTQFPMFVVVVDEKIHVGYDADWDVRERIEEPSDRQLCTACRAIADDMKELPPQCDDCASSGFIYYRSKQAYCLNPGVFFTAKACQDHIDANHYHYTNPRVYGIGCWRNGELPLIMQAILSCDGNPDIPSHYR